MNCQEVRTGFSEKGQKLSLVIFLVSLDSYVHIHSLLFYIQPDQTFPSGNEIGSSAFSLTRRTKPVHMLGTGLKERVVSKLKDMRMKNLETVIFLAS